MTDLIRAWIEANKHYIKSENFNFLYQGLKYYNSEAQISNVPDLTKALIDADINPLDYMKAVPDYFAYALPRKYLNQILPLPSNIKSIGFGSFESAPLQTINLSDIKTISIKAFYAAGLIEIALPENASIGTSSFAKSALEKVIVGKGDCIFSDAFAGCIDLSKVILPDVFTIKGSSVFKDCPNLKQLTYKGLRSQWEALNINEEWSEQSSIQQVICLDDVVDIFNYKY